MVVAIVHLSDIHFKESQSPIVAKMDALAAAIGSADASCRHYVIVLSGDIAFSGSAGEYHAAKEFFERLAAAITARQSGAAVEYVSVPGNHDCYLPEERTGLRAALIQGIRESIRTDKPDGAILNALLDDQRNYFAFAAGLESAAWPSQDRLCLGRIIEAGRVRLRFNLYNTALLSTRHERQGELALPSDLSGHFAAENSECEQRISVFHHPYPWLGADVGITFRNYVEQTSDIALTGHQHFDHAYSAQMLEGSQSIFYSEGDVLQDLEKPDESGFRIILLDSDAMLRRILSYRWSSTRYTTRQDTDWRPYTRGACKPGLLAPTREFIALLSESDIGLTHHSKGPLPLNAVFVYPDASVRTMSAPETVREIRGGDLLRYISERSRLTSHTTKRLK